MNNDFFSGKNIFKAVAALIGSIILLVIVVNILDFFVVIGPGERGILLQFGNVKGIYEPGLHFQVPILNSVVKMDVRTQKVEDEVKAASKDLQSIDAVIALNFHVDPAKVGDIYQRLGMDVTDRIIKPAIQESVKAVTAQFTAEELITARISVKENIRKSMMDRLGTYDIIVDEVSIVNFSFSEAFNNSIEEKQTAVQNWLKAENDLKRIKTEAQQVIETAKADAESIRIQGEALKDNKDLIQLKLVEKWDGKLPVYSMGGSTPLIQLPN